MTVQFSRSVRSIQADNLGPMLVGTVFFTVLMVGWVLWFFFATIPYYEESASATFQQDGYIMATFPATAFSRLQYGQAAQFKPATTSRTAPMLPLIVTDLYPETNRVRLVLRMPDDDARHLQPGALGQVKVTVDKVSPALVVLRSAGLMPDS